MVDGEDRENEGDLVFAAQFATPELMAFMVRHTSGYVCVAMPDEWCDRLALPPMCAVNQDPRTTAYTVSVDAAVGISTGISARDRALTLALLADRTATADDFNRPGHVLPLRAKPGGTLERVGHTEAAVDLCKLAGVEPVGVLCEVVSESSPGEMARRPELEAFAAAHGLVIVSIAQLATYRRLVETRVERHAETRMPTAHGDFLAVGFGGASDDPEYLALVRGTIGDGVDVAVHVHTECLTGDIFGSRACDCRRQLVSALAAVSDAGRGVVLYARPRGSAADLTHVRPAAGEQVLAAQVLMDLGIRTAHPALQDAATLCWLRHHGLAAESPAGVTGRIQSSTGSPESPCAGEPPAALAG